jgi:CRP-like cAMP-binding protein
LPNLFCRRLENYAVLTETDRRALDSCVQRLSRLEPHTDIIQEGDGPKHVNVVLDGWACRYKQFEDGRRQIVSFIIPGDYCDLDAPLLDHVSHSLGTLTPVSIARVTQDELADLMMHSEELRRALRISMLVEVDIQREWTISLGRRTATERLAHLFCEISMRLRSVGLTNGRECQMPVTQADLADALGLSTVHVNRTLQDLRATDLVELRGKRLTIRNERGLREVAMFDPTYLHLQHNGNGGLGVT